MVADLPVGPWDVGRATSASGFGRMEAPSVEDGDPAGRRVAGPRKESTTASTSDLEGARSSLPLAAGAVDMYRLAWLAEQGIGAVPSLPNTLKILLEDLLRRAGTRDVDDADVAALAA
jgi:hypothetical protein